MDSSLSVNLDSDHEKNDPIPLSLPALSSSENFKYEQDPHLCTGGLTLSNLENSTQYQETPPCGPWCGDEGLPCYACSTVGANSLYQFKELEKIMNQLKLSSSHLMENDRKSESCFGNKEENLKCSSKEVGEEEDVVTSSRDIKDMKYAAFESQKIQVVGRDNSSIILRVLLTDQDGLYTQSQEYSQTSQGNLPWGPLSNIGDFIVHCPEQVNNQDMRIKTTYMDYFYAAVALVFLVNVFGLAVVYLNSYR